MATFTEKQFNAYLEENYVPFSFGEIHTFINAKGEEKKQLEGILPFQWQKLTAERTFCSGNSIGIITGEKSNITVIDFDTEESYEQAFTKYPEMLETMSVKTHRGYHLYFNYYPELKNLSNILPEIDCRNDGGFVIAPPTKYKNLAGEECKYITIQDGKKIDIPAGFLNDIKQYRPDAFINPEVTVRTVSTESVKATDFTSYEESILNNIHQHYYTDYDAWLKFIWAIRFSGFKDALEIADLYSRRLPNYNSKTDVEKYMNDCKEQRIGWGYLMNLSKKSNLAQHKMILAERYLWKGVITEYDHSVFGRELVENVIKKNDALYIYENGFWVKDTTKKESKIMGLLIATIRKFYIEIQKSLFGQDMESEEIQKKVKKICNLLIDLGSTSKCNGIMTFFRMDMPECVVEFDQHPYIFCFKNCAFDLRTGQQITITKEHYITQHTGNDYIPPSQEALALMNKLLTQIFPDPDIKRCYLSMLFMGMTGIRVEKFFVANGKGRNGKGFLNEMFMSLIGEEHYGYVLPVSVLTSKQDIGTGANPQIANMNMKRMIIAREPEEDTKIRSSVVKTFTGDGVINARQLHSGICIVYLLCVLMMECNEKLQLSGTMNQAMLDRIIDIPFVSIFTNVETEDTVKHIYPVKPEYKEKPFKEAHRCALFHIILAGSRELYIPDQIKQQSKEYVMSSDEIYMWVKENYDEGTEDDIISAKDLYMSFTNSDKFKQFSKEEKRQMTKKRFTSMIENSISFRGQYRVPKKTVNGITYCERLHYWKLKVEEEDKLDELA
jgi:phage/plasmid-associated DNA primase